MGNSEQTKLICKYFSSVRLNGETLFWTSKNDTVSTSEETATGHKLNRGTQSEQHPQTRPFSATLCHLCRKIDSAATKPLTLVFSKLHESVEPHLGTVYTWRLAKTKIFYDIVGGIYRKMPLAAVKEILDEVEKEVRYLEKGLIDLLKLGSGVGSSRLNKRVASKEIEREDGRDNGNGKGDMV